MDIIVTTPKSRMREAAEEAEDCKRAGGGEYFRRFSRRPPVEPGDRVYYVEDGYVRGFAVVARLEAHEGLRCQTTSREWPPGWYVFMDATTWRWIRPIPMKGFQGYRRAEGYLTRFPNNPLASVSFVMVIGGWLDPKPSTGGFHVLRLEFLLER